MIPAIKSLEREDLSEYSYSFFDVENNICYNFVDIEFLRWKDESYITMNLELDPPQSIGKGKGEGIVKDTFKAVSEAIKYINKVKNE